jgi:poly(glycerol-phosphate) alpha-glucosyltransferase
MRGLRGSSTGPPEITGPPEPLDPSPSPGGTRRIRTDEDGEALQIDRFRSDGSLLAVDRRDLRERGRLGGRRITLVDRRGNAVVGWDSDTALHHAWLDWVIGDGPATLISDSSPIGGALHTYRRDHITVVQVLHNPHLKDPAGSPYGLLPPAKKEILAHLDDYDLVTTLTDDQRRDMRAVSLAGDNLRTVSNMYSGPVVEHIDERPPARGVLVGRLVEQKRVAHAIRAMAHLHGSSPATLDVYGTGSHEDRLAALIAELDVGETVRLHGFRHDARSQFRSASFSILSSRFEGQGLVLLESMAAGCIPVSYDITYGPSDIITNGVDGFLVPAGDIEALAATIARVVALDSDRLRRMRAAAVRRAADFAPEVIVRKWGEVLTEAVEGKRPHRVAGGKASLLRASAVPGGTRLVLDVALDAEEDVERVLVVWSGRRAAAFGREPVPPHGTTSPVRVDVVLPHTRFQDLGRGLLDVFVDVRTGGVTHRLRVSAPDLPQSVGDGPAEFYATRYGNLSIRLHPDRG